MLAVFYLVHPSHQSVDEYVVSTRGSFLSSLAVQAALEEVKNRRVCGGHDDTAEDAYRFGIEGEWARGIFEEVQRMKRSKQHHKACKKSRGREKRWWQQQQQIEQ